jgi:hypothetical protein
MITVTPHSSKSPARRSFLLSVAAVLLAGMGLTGHALADDKTPQVSIKTSLGEIVVELDAEKAPITVENFLKYVKKGHYNGTVFHRVIENFMIQGVCF